MMGSYSISLLPLLILAVFVFSFWKILPRAGIAAPWSLTVIFGPMMFVWLWVLAFKKWPNDSLRGE